MTASRVLLMTLLLVLVVWFIVDLVRTERPLSYLKNPSYSANALPPIIVVKCSTEGEYLQCYDVYYYRYGVSPHWYEPYQRIKFLTTGESRYYAEGIVPQDNILNSDDIVIANVIIEGGYP